MKIPYKVLDTFVLRTPLLPIDFFIETTSGTSVSEKQLKAFLKDSKIREALFIASHSFWSQVLKWENSVLDDPRKVDRLKQSILKYLSRMSSRPTPFGLFAGSKVNRFENLNNHTKTPRKSKRKTKLDMHYLVGLIMNLEKQDHIRKQLKFFPNSSLYRIGDQLRYIEHKYENDKRIYYLSAAMRSRELDLILNMAESGTYIDKLCKSILNDDVTRNDAAYFIDQLINSQILISELEPSVSGVEPFDCLIDILSRLQGCNPILAILQEIRKDLIELDTSNGFDINKYGVIKDKIKALGAAYDLDKLFQVDYYINEKSVDVDYSFTHKSKIILAVLNRLKQSPDKTRLNTFKSNFIERYGTKPVKLAKVLDVEIGIGYFGNFEQTIAPLVDDIILPNHKSDQTIIKLSPLQHLISEKITKTLHRREYTIELKDIDLKIFDMDWDNLPDTISGVFEVFMVKGEQKIRVKSIGGSSGINMIGRFCNSDSDLKRYAQQIAAIEKEANPNAILAEIIHLPQNRLGNVLMRPNFRDYEIPYLAKSHKPKNQLIHVKDLILSVENDRMVLRSEKLNREILPRLSNAHNHQLKGMPVYNFLCDLQNQDQEDNLDLDLNPLSDVFEFIPRIVYDDLILSPAQWNLKNSRFSHLIDDTLNKPALLKKVGTLRKELNVPQYVLFQESDNELLLNLCNYDCVQLLLKAIKHLDRFVLVEFFYSDGSPVHDTYGSYTNEIILTFYNSEKLQNAHV